MKLGGERSQKIDNFFVCRDLNSSETVFSIIRCLIFSPCMRSLPDRKKKTFSYMFRQDFIELLSGKAFDIEGLVIHFESDVDCRFFLLSHD